jgi:hypothetical protein
MEEGFFFNGIATGGNHPVIDQGDKPASLVFPDTAAAFFPRGYPAEMMTASALDTSFTEFVI